MVLVAVMALLLFLSVDSFAKIKGEVKAEKEFLWSTLVRFIRVDCNYKIIEKDMDGGYLIFQYKDASKGKPACRSTVEIIPDSNPQKKSGGVTLQVSIPCAGMVQEKLIIDGLQKKIEEEK